MYTFTRNRLGQFPSHFCQSSGPIISSSRNLFQGHGVIVTSSRRHFVNIRSLSYLDNKLSKINHIWYTSTSGQRSTKNVNKFHARTLTRAYARIKILKCSNSSQILFAHVSGHFRHFIKIAQNTHFLRFFVRSGQTKNNSLTRIFDRIFLNFFRTIWYHVYFFMTIIDGISVRLK